MTNPDPLNETVINSYAPLNLSPLSHTTPSVYLVTSQMLKKTEYDYDENFRRKRTTQAPTTSDAATTFFGYDEVGNLKTVDDPRTYRTTYDYDNRNRQYKITNNTPSEITTVEYDFVGNKTKETRQDGTFRSWDYDSVNRLHYAYDWRLNDPPTASQTTTYGRDPGGNVRTITDTKGAVYAYDYDLMNRKQMATYPPDATGSRTESWQFEITLKWGRSLLLDIWKATEKVGAEWGQV